MALTYISGPAYWSAVKNPVVKKFSTTGGPFTNYRVEIELFRASDDSSLTDGVKFSFSPDADGFTYADLSQILRAYIAPDWTKPSALNEADTRLKVYMKYQELYDGSATSVVDNSESPFQVVFAGLQIPSANGNNLTDYVPASSSKKFLTIFDRPKLWRGYPATLSFIFPDGLALYVSREQNDNTDTLITASVDVLDTTKDDAVNRLDLLSGITIDDDSKSLDVVIGTTTTGTEILTNSSLGGDGTPWVSVAGGGLDWTFPGGAAYISFTAGEQVSDPLRQDFTEQSAGWYSLYIVMDATGTSTLVNVSIKVYNDGVLVSEILNASYLDPNTSPLSFNKYIPSAFDRIEVVISKSGATSFLFQFFDVSLKPLVITPYTETLTFDVETPCNNPVMLMWKNSLGGDAFWLFEHDQEVSYTTSNKRAKRMVLTANNLTVDQWEALNELNTLGEVYKQNIVEFTSSVNKSHKRYGAQVYIVDTDGNKTGVIAIPTSYVMFTRQKKHQFKIEIELPERYE